MKNGKGSLTLAFVDVDGNRLQDTGQITLAHRTLIESETLLGDLGKTFRFFGIREAPKGTYVLTVRPDSYQSARRFVIVRGAELMEIPLLVKPNKVRPVFDPIDPRVLDLLERSDVRWSKLGPRQRACLLNIAAKSFVTPIQNRKGILEHVTLLKIKHDRVWCAVPEKLFHRVSTSWGLYAAPDALHEPPVGYMRYGSYKTRDEVGNLQITFFRHEREKLTLDLGLGKPPLYVADVDIDNASGLAHALDVVKHTITGKGTHPYDIHDVLVYWQGLDPGYRLEPK